MATQLLKELFRGIGGIQAKSVEGAMQTQMMIECTMLIMATLRIGWMWLYMPYIPRERILRYYTFFFIALALQVLDTYSHVKQLTCQATRIINAFYPYVMLYGVLLTKKSAIRPPMRKIILDAAYYMSVMSAFKIMYVSKLSIVFPRSISNYFVPSECMGFLFSYVIPYFIEPYVALQSFFMGPVLAMMLGFDNFQYTLTLCQTGYALLLS